MILYEIRLVCPETQEKLFQATGESPTLPSLHFYSRTPKPVLIINMKSISQEEWKKSCQQNLNLKNLDWGK